MQLSDGVIALRPIAVADAEAHLAAADPERVRGLDGGPGTLESVTAHFEKCVADWAAEGPERMFAITAEDGAALVGTLEIRTDRIFLAPGQADLFFDIYPAWRGRRLATRAVILGCRYLARTGLADEVVLRIDPTHAASVGVARRARFHYLRSSDEPGVGPLDWYIQAL
ncbi:GNAT family N-acetyltransferase [Nocardia bhagyanarayanae]|uniref:RimJ/RimL family protein N-acetyltransferase n=1 Tax=Nocardia bhagyanarayanae TaxID=1215925 RepID=A0A543FE22_9NOCA|nr:GNAT family N-acetyltransferase [Nocardia bhagyanarayanae]TQM32004.1 RimJ/RimL family protein N-acetyltransferase [Nocardia bhagyanarayanae]